MQMTAADVLALRMASLLLAPSGAGGVSHPDSVAGVVEWMGAMQAQDAASGLWALGLRLPHLTETDVVAALERREALRTWPMRGTVHLVPARDARWMLDLMGAKPLAGAAARRATIGLDDAQAERAVEVLGEALAGGGRLTRAECLATLEEAGVDCTGQRSYHLLWYVSQRGVTCIAPHIGKEQTFVLLDEWVPNPHRPEREEALAIIAVRFFQSHGPATRADLARWTGLTAADAKLAIAAAGDALVVVPTELGDLICTPQLRDAPRPSTSRADAPAYLALPGFDEYMLGYKDRSLMVDAERMAAIVPGGNGVFQSTLVRDGRVVGVWKRTATERRSLISAFAFVEPQPAEKQGIEAAFAPYAAFTGKPVEVRWS